MSEAEIIEQLSNIYDRYWFMMQWWTSVSFLLIAITHFAIEKIGALLLFAIVLLYAFYSVYMQIYLAYNVDIMAGFLQELETLKNSGKLMSPGAKAYLDSPYRVLGDKFATLVPPATFFFTLTYIVHAFFRSKNVKNI